MLYGKIYIDNNEEGKEMLVFVALTVDAKDAFTACQADFTAISPEAKSAFLAKLNSPDRRLSRYLGDFELFGDDEWEHGVFRFKERECKKGQRRRAVFLDESISIKVNRGCRRSVLEYMIPCDNDFLKSLDLTERIDENTLWERYYSEMKERGEMPACNTETIKKTPPSFLTEEQKEVIRADYFARREAFGEYHCVHSSEVVDELVTSELMNAYSKSAQTIKQICGIGK